MSERKNTSWIVWGSVVLLVSLVIYPLSFGPAVWLNQKMPSEFSMGTVIGAFAPIERLHLLSPDWIRRISDRYFAWWTGGYSLSGYISDREILREYLRENPL